MRSDLSILEDLGASLAPVEEHPPAEIRHRVMNGMRSRPPRRGVRLAWRIGAPAVAAAAVTAAVVAGQLADIAGRQPAPPGRGTATAAAPDHTTATKPDAGKILQLAAQFAAATPAMDARPNQFLYIDSVEIESKKAAQRTRTWLSVDGTHDGLVTQGATRTHLDGCKNGRQAQTIDRPETTPKVACTPEPAYQPGRIPTDGDGLLAYVYRVVGAEPVWVSVGRGPDGTPKGYVALSADQRAFTELAEILYKNHLPAVQEAAFRAAGRIPGVRVSYRVADAAGRVGVAVTRTEAGTREELVFDQATYRYLGYNIIAAAFDLTGAKVVKSPGGAGGTSRIRLGPNPTPGEVIYKSALLRVAIVDRAGERP